MLVEQSQTPSPSSHTQSLTPQSPGSQSLRPSNLRSQKTDVPKEIRIAVFLSGRGSNLSALGQTTFTGGRLVRVFSNKPHASGLGVAQSFGIPTTALVPKNYPTREAFDEAILEVLQQDQVHLILLAGYNQILTPVLLNAYPQQILNIHPSLLPKYGGTGMVGMKVHQAVIEAMGQEDGETESGCTVHLVTDVVDGGPILGQRRVSLSSSETAITLADKVLKEEHRLYPVVVQDVLLGKHSEVPLNHVLLSS